MMDVVLGVVYIEDVGLPRKRLGVSLVKKAMWPMSVNTLLQPMPTFGQGLLYVL